MGNGDRGNIGRQHHISKLNAKHQIQILINVLLPTVTMNQDRVNNVIVKITVTHWHKERHAHSLFSCPSSNSSLKRTERKNLRVPLFFFAPQKIFWLREIQPFSPLPKLQLLAFPTLHPKPFLLEQSFRERPFTTWQKRGQAEKTWIPTPSEAPTRS